jgi:hypothetical protein
MVSESPQGYPIATDLHGQGSGKSEELGRPASAEIAWRHRDETRAVELLLQTISLERTVVELRKPIGSSQARLAHEVAVIGCEILQRHDVFLVRRRLPEHDVVDTIAGPLPVGEVTHLTIALDDRIVNAHVFDATRLLKFRRRRAAESGNTAFGRIVSSISSSVRQFSAGRSFERASQWSTARVVTR